MVDGGSGRWRADWCPSNYISRAGRIAIVPKIVDHDQRRAELVEAAWRVIARDGLAQTTTREIAREAGYSNGVLAHYFADKEAILDRALQLAFDRTSARIKEWTDEHHGLDALRGALLLALPLDAESRLGVEVEVSFWGRAVGNPALGAVQDARLRAWAKVIRQLVTGAIETGQLRPDVPINETVDLLTAVIDGLSLQGALYPRRYGPRRLVAAIDAVLATLQ